MTHEPELHHAGHTNNSMHSDEIADSGANMQKRPNPSVHGLERLQDKHDKATIGLLVHSLYVGSRDGNPFHDEDRQTVIAAVSYKFDCFTVIDADGYFKGLSVATLVIKIATDDEAAVLELGRLLGRLLDQEAVGLEVSGYYRSIPMDAHISDRCHRD